MALFCKTCGTRVPDKAAQDRHCAGHSSLAARSFALARPVGHPAGDRVIDAYVVLQGGASLARVRPEPLARRVDPVESKRRAVRFLLWPFHRAFFPDLFPASNRTQSNRQVSEPEGLEEIRRLLTEGR